MTDTTDPQGGTDDLVLDDDAPVDRRLDDAEVDATDASRLVADDRESDES